jgi:hypothetical protein
MVSSVGGLASGWVHSTLQAQSQLPQLQAKHMRQNMQVNVGGTGGMGGVNWATGGVLGDSGR